MIMTTEEIMKADASLEELTGEAIRGVLYTSSGARIIVWNRELVSGIIDGDSSSFGLVPRNFSFTPYKVEGKND